MDSRLARYAIQSFVGEPDLIGFNLSFVSNSSALSRHAPHFEKIGEVGAELDRKIDIDGCEAIVDESQRLVTSRLPQQFRSSDMKGSPRQQQSFTLIDIGIGQVHDQEQIVFLDHRIQQKRDGRCPV